ncbi:hypothetical protein JCM8097_003961 [Rhodosporidiobolus ruineniae]
MPLAITTYLIDTPSLRSPLYYATWGLYYLSYALSPGLVTVLQVLVMALTAGLPHRERATERWRVRVAHHEWATTRLRDEFVDPRAPPAEWPGWLKATGNALDVRWVGSSVWGGVSGAVKWIGSWFGMEFHTPRLTSSPSPSAPSAAYPLQPVPAFSAQRPPSVRSATMPASASVAQDYPAAGAAGYASSFNSVPLQAAGSVRSRQFSAHGSATPRAAASNPFSPRAGAADHDDDRGSVWSGSGWKKA